MANQILNPGKALRTLRKTPAILGMVTSSISQAEAEALCDGPDGWSMLFIVCHLRDYEQIVLQRMESMLQQEHPHLPRMDNDALIEQHQYAEQDFATVLAELTQYRQQLLQLLESLSEEQWLRTGLHPEQGPGTILEMAINAGLHDINHIEQLLRCGNSDWR